MRILICGARDFDRVDVFDRVVLTAIWKSGNHHPRDAMTPDPEKVEIISGMARGADTLAVDFAKKHGLTLHEFPADWERYGPKAGPLRNQQMIDEGHPDLVIAFPTASSRGTYDMIRRADSRNIKTIVIKEEE